MKDLKQTFAAVAMVVMGGSALGQTNAVYAWRNFVGQPGGPGSVDGTGSAARFYGPPGVAADSTGNVYVADFWNHTIRKVTSDGVVTTLAGSPGCVGTNDGTGSTARFKEPSAVAVDSAGNVYVAEWGNCDIRKVTPGGTVTTLAGKPGVGGYADGTGNAARFYVPAGIAVDSLGTVYVADTGNDTVRKVTTGGVVTTLAGSSSSSGTNDGTGIAARFNSPFGLAVDNAGTLYVGDSGNHTIRKVTSIGVVTTLAGWPGNSGTNDGVGTAAQFNNPRGVAVEGAGNVYVADYGNCTIRQITSAAEVATLAGSAGNQGCADGTGSAARFSLPQGVAVDSSGRLFVADSSNDTIRRLTTGGVVTTLAGSLAQAGSVDSTGSLARLNYPTGVAVDSAGNVYVGDMANETIRKVTSGGVVTTLAGSVRVSGTNDGTGSAAQFYWPSGVAVDSVGTMYVADFYNDTIRKVTKDGVVTTLAGLGGVSGANNGTGSAARFEGPFAVVLDNEGNLIVADSGNHTIRKVTISGVVTTLAGFGGRSGTNDGTGTAARFNGPSGVAVDSAGNVFVGDWGNHTIRKMTSAGVVTTLAGSGGHPGSADGTGSAARFNNPNMVAVDSGGNVYVADTGNHTIRRVTSGGVVTTIGGTAGVAGEVDGLGSSANFAQPYGVALDNTGRVYVADAWNNRISIGTPMPGMSIARSASSVIISWPSWATTFSLEQNADMLNAKGWHTSDYTISDDGTNKSITVSSPAESLFFRLLGN